MSAQSIIDELQDVETALEELSEIYDVHNNRFTRALDLSRFQARKKQYKALRVEAERWAKNHGFELEEDETLERGLYFHGTYFHDTAADNPFRWSIQALRVRRELQRALQHTLPVSSAAPNLYLINLQRNMFY